jgi:molybdopterin-synthase adenylyltransferase
MKPQVFVYQHQFEQLFAGDTNPAHLELFCYEWQNEGVFHLYTQHPASPPSATRISAVFTHKTCKEEWDGAATLFEYDCVFQSYALGVFAYKESEHVAYKVVLRAGASGIITAELNYIPDRHELFSRSKGILETDMLQHKRVLMVGLGSFGGQIAVELAKAGVSHFDLVDFDRIELSNISRHICGINDLGRWKTRAVKDVILQKNPYASVHTYEMDINARSAVLDDLVHASDLILCLTDNNRSRFNINELAIQYDKTVLFGRAITRAEGGDIFVCRGNDSPCYACLIEEANIGTLFGQEEISSLQQATTTLPAYTSPEDKEARIQVGLSADIQPICQMLVKLALVEVARGMDHALSNLENELTYNYYFWANRRERQYTNFRPFNDSRSKPTILRWYGVHVPNSINCWNCSSNALAI